jgi:hypothetical protein
MSIPSHESTAESKLRVDAEARLKAGSAPPTRGWSTGVSALNLLHELASSPQRADDALKLLHELQVHQVELDLQHEQMEATQREMSEELARYQAFYQFVPVASLGVGPDGDVLEGNAAAADLFGVAQFELRGRRVEALMAPESRPALVALLKRLRAGSSTDVCEVKSGVANGSRTLQLRARTVPESGCFLMALIETTGPRRSDLRT